MIDRPVVCAHRFFPADMVLITTDVVVVLMDDFHPWFHQALDDVI